MAFAAGAAAPAEDELDRGNEVTCAGSTGEKELVSNASPDASPAAPVIAGACVLHDMGLRGARQIS